VQVIIELVIIVLVIIKLFTLLIIIVSIITVLVMIVSIIIVLIISPQSLEPRFHRNYQELFVPGTYFIGTFFCPRPIAYCIYTAD